MWPQKRVKKRKEPETFVLVKGHKILAKSVGRSVFLKEIGCDQSTMQRSDYFGSFWDDLQLVWPILTSSFLVAVPFSLLSPVLFLYLSLSSPPLSKGGNIILGDFLG